MQAITLPNTRYCWRAALPSARDAELPVLMASDVSRSDDLIDRRLPPAGLRRAALNGWTGDFSGHLFGFGAAQGARKGVLEAWQSHSLIAAMQTMAS